MRSFGTNRYPLVILLALVLASASAVPDFSETLGAKGASAFARESGASGGKGRGGSSDGHGGRNDGPSSRRGGDRAPERSSNRSRHGAKLEADGSNIEVTTRDGFRQTIKDGRFELEDPLGRTVVQRRATARDRARLLNLQP